MDGCQDGDGFAGAEFQYLAANVVSERDRQNALPAVRDQEFDGVKVGFIGMTLEGTPTIVTPPGSPARVPRRGGDGQRARPGAASARASRPSWCSSTRAAGRRARSTSAGISGTIVDIVDELDRGGRRRHRPHAPGLQLRHRRRPVTSAASFGRIITDIDLDDRPGDGGHHAIPDNNVIVTRDVAADPATTALIAKYNPIAAPLANRVIGTITADIRGARTPPASQPWAM